MLQLLAYVLAMRMAGDLEEYLSSYYVMFTKQRIHIGRLCGLIWFDAWIKQWLYNVSIEGRRGILELKIPLDRLGFRFIVYVDVHMYKGPGRL
jgi:hypothetical protein